MSILFEDKFSPAEYLLETSPVSSFGIRFSLCAKFFWPGSSDGSKIGRTVRKTGSFQGSRGSASSRNRSIFRESAPVFRPFFFTRSNYTPADILSRSKIKFNRKSVRGRKNPGAVSSAGGIFPSVLFFRRKPNFSGFRRIVAGSGSKQLTEQRFYSHSAKNPDPRGWRAARFALEWVWRPPLRGLGGISANFGALS